MRALLLLLAASAAFGQEWKAGLAKTAITPAEPVWMAGFGSRTKPSEGVRRDLYVKALALEDRAGHVSVIVTTDIIGYTRAMADEIRTRTGLAPARLMLSASHTHSSPVAGQLGRPGYMLNERDSAAARRYSKFLLDSVVKVIGQARRDLRPATLSFAQGFAGFGVNRRRVRVRSLPGPVDQDVPVLMVRAPGGELRAVVAGYACHATVLSDYKISGDWPGYFQEEFERAHPGAEALFVQGCGADVNALPRNTEELARKYGQILAAAVSEVVRGKAAPVTGPLQAAFDTVDLPFGPPPTREQLQAELKSANHTHRNNAANLLKVLDSGGKLPESYPYPIAVWQFGKGPRWIVLASEVVVDYSLRLKAQYGWKDTWVSAYANDFCGYIPSLRVLKEGGYEGGEAMAAQGHPGPWGESVEERVVGKVGELTRRATSSGLPRVLLIGSSVSVGYTAPVQKQLAGEAEVHRIPGMAGNTANIVQHLDEWLGESRWDVIHFTFGLRDPTRGAEGALAVPPPEFEKNVAWIVKRLRATGARLIWASATPVPRDDMKPVRKTADVLAYNAAARAIMTANGVALNDLYAFALPRLKEIQRPNNVHFTQAGSEALGAEVAAAIRAELRALTASGASRKTPR